MGKSDLYVYEFYKKFIHIKPNEAVALLGFKNNHMFKGELYDLQLNNFDINSNWHLTSKTYDVIISLRCPYFARNPEIFLQKCHEHLNPGGRLYVDWGIGDHWRFTNYKIGWKKDGEHEWAYEEDNYLWSTVWSEKYYSILEFNIFLKNIKKFGYTHENFKKKLYEETPSVLDYKYFKKLFAHAKIEMLTLWEDKPQLYILLKGVKQI